MTLKIKAFNNYGQFDEIRVTQVQKFKGDLRAYQVDKPSGNWPLIKHHRDDGWLQLMKKVIDVLDDAQ